MCWLPLLPLLLYVLQAKVFSLLLQLLWGSSYDPFGNQLSHEGQQQLQTFLALLALLWRATCCWGCHGADDVMWHLD